MKRFTMILALLLITALPMMAERVTPETARKVATTFLNNNGAKTTQLTDLSKEAGFQNLYIFTAEQGFVVMAADDCVKPILGYSLTGKFVAENMPSHVSGWLQKYDDEIQYAIGKQVKASSDTEQQWKDLKNGKPEASKSTPIVTALLLTQWDQGSPYNNQCPTIGGTRTVTGCVATAMAQVMKFWEHPATGSESHSYTWNNQTLSANFGETTYDWNNMTNTYGSSSTDNQKTAVATLMYHCGVSLEMKYNTSSNGGSSASTYDVMESLQTYFGYAPCMKYKSKDDYSEETWITMLKRELNDGRPLQYRGSDADGNGGHSFVCDGYDSDDLFHFNWGWGGYCDGFYTVDDMEPGIGGIGAGNGIYTVGESAIFGIEPINNSLTAPTLSASVNQNIVTLTWNVIEGAASYDIYKDNEKICTGITDTAYTDSDIEFGVYYEYYVRAVSSSTRSNPSNHVTKFSLYRDITPSNLTIDFEDIDTVLTWTGYQGGLSTDLHYGTVMSKYLYGTESPDDTYWAHRYPTTTLSQIEGMTITKVSTYFYFAGTYKMYLYSGNIDENTRTKLAEQTFSKSNRSVEWVDFTFNTPINIDCSKDLWVVFYTDSSVTYPILFDEDYADDNNAKFLSSTLESLFSSESIENYDISWLIYTYLTDGTYTYNLYDNGTSVASNISDAAYTVSNIADNTVHQYTVKTNYYGGESAASNMAGLTLGTASLNSLVLGDNDKMTITEGSSLTVNEGLVNENPGNLILEDGAQLIHNSNNVQATVLKDIVPYTTDSDGWNFIASPVTESFAPSSGTGFLNGNSESNTFDLYYYDEPSHLWKNYESQSFDIQHKKGYLYANGETEGTTLEFVGTLLPSNNTVTISDLSNEAEELNGFNLVGNPFACNATVDQDYYVINNTTNTVTLPPQGHIIAPCEAVFVQATEDNTTVTFNKAEARSYNNSFDITLSQGRAYLDRARVRLDEGRVLEKYNLNGKKDTRLFIPQHGQELAVACANGQNEMPLNFKAAKNGTYTLAFDGKDLDLDYFHLIDNMTGEDVDLLATPSYTFESKTTDYASRFRLLFATKEDGASTGSETFASYANGEIRLVETCHGASLQVVDIMGRIVFAGDAINRVSTSGMTHGIYVLRLIDGETVRTQKIVIE